MFIIYIWIPRVHVVLVYPGVLHVLLAAAVAATAVAAAAGEAAAKIKFQVLGKHPY